MRISFREKDHKYINEEGTEYISVSSLSKKLERPKDWDLILKKSAKKLGVKPEELKVIWQNKKDKGVEAGTKVHKKSEQERLNSPSIILNNVECEVASCSFSDGLKWSEPNLKLKNNTIYPECMIYDHLFKICGQSDEVWVINNTIHVFDIKTDKSIQRQAYQSEFVSPEKFLAPVEHLDNCNFNMYSLKMSMYMYMLWKHNKNLKIGDLLLEWQPIARDEDGIPILDEEGEPSVLKKEIIKVPYLRREIKDIFDYYKLGKIK